MVFSGKVDEVTLPGTEGAEFGVLCGGHEPFDIGGYRRALLSLPVGKIILCCEYRLCGSDRKVTVLIETAERNDAIDKDRAIKAKETATASLAQLNKEHEDHEKMRLALVRAINRKRC